MKYLSILLCLLFVGCMSLDRQSGGTIDVTGRLGQADITQAQNAKEPATLNYSEDGVTIPTNPDDELNIVVEKKPDGSITKSIKFKPKSQSSNVVVSGVNADADSGASWEDKVGQLQVFMKNAKLILWAGVGFLAAGGLFIGFLRDVRSGLVLGGIGVAMLVSYSILPQLYSNYAIVLGMGVIAIPVMWYLHYKKTERIAKASVKAYETLKIKNPELAKEHSLHFKEHINPRDLEQVKKLK